MKIERKEILRTLHEEHRFSDLFVAYMVNGTIAPRPTWWINCSTQAKSGWHERFCQLARFGKQGRSEPVIPGVIQQTLAEMIDTTRPRVNFFMNKFRKLGFIEYNGGLKVHSSLLGVVLHD
jgi:CRP/FNR family cyclic AMP-dependent transcriptional regulator